MVDLSIVMLICQRVSIKSTIRSPYTVCIPTTYHKISISFQDIGQYHYMHIPYTIHRVQYTTYIATDANMYLYICIYVYTYQGIYLYIEDLFPLNSDTYMLQYAPHDLTKTTKRTERQWSCPSTCPTARWDTQEFRQVIVFRTTYIGIEI